MTDVLFVVDSHRGHLHATLGLADRLSRRGAEVRYCGPPGAAAAVEAHGYPFRAVECLDLDRSDRPVDVAALEADREVGRLLAELRPDVVVFDPFLLIAYPLFWARGVAVAALSTKPLFRREGSPPYTSRLVPRPGRLGRARVHLAWGRQWLRYAAYRGWTAARARLGTPSMRSLMRAMAAQVEFPWAAEWVTRPLSFDVRFASVPEVVLAAPEFELSTGPTPRGAIYAGPCVDLSRTEPAFDWSWMPPDAQLVYCSLGTVAGQLDATASRLVRRVAGAFAGRPGWAVLIAVPNDDLAASIDTTAGNVRVATWVPQLACLRRAAVVVTHGGHNTVKECLLSGVPMVVYPRRADQFGNSARVVYHGVGTRGRAWRDGPRSIRRKVERTASDPRIRADVDALRRSVARVDRTDLAVDQLLRMGGRPQSTNSRSTEAVPAEGSRPGT